MVNDEEFARLQLEVQWLRQTVGTLISWLAQSNGSGLTYDDATRLFNIMDGYVATSQDSQRELKRDSRVDRMKPTRVG